MLGPRRTSPSLFPSCVQGRQVVMTTKKPAAVTLHFLPWYISSLLLSLCIKEKIHFLSFALAHEMAKRRTIFSFFFFFLC